MWVVEIGYDLLWYDLLKLVLILAYSRYCQTSMMKCFCQKRLKAYSQYRSSHRRCSVEKWVLRDFVKFTGKHLSQSFFFNKIEDLKLQRLYYRCIPVNFAKFLGTTILQKTSWRLHLSVTIFAKNLHHKYSIMIWRQGLEDSALMLYFSEAN